MTQSSRKKLGSLLTVIALAAIPALVLAGVPLVTMTSTDFSGTGVTEYHLEYHWPLAIAGVAFVVLAAGAALIFLPLRKGTA